MSALPSPGPTAPDVGWIVASVPEVIAAVALDGTLLYVSAAGRGVYGHEPADLVGTRSLDLVDPIDRAEVAERLARIAGVEGAADRMTVRVLRSDGDPTWIDVTGRCVRDPASDELVIVTVAREATELVEREDALDRVQGRFRALVEWLPAVVYEAEPGPAGRFQFVSSQIEDLLGYTQAQWLADPRRWYEALHPDSRDAVVEEERHLAAESLGTGRRMSSEYRMLRRDGRPIWVRDIALLTDEEDGSQCWRGVLIDITAEREAAERVAEANRRYRRVIEGLPACAYRSEVGVLGGWEYVSPHIERLLGYTPEEWTADPTLWRASLHADDRERMEAQEEGLLEAPAGSEAVSEYRLRHREGRTVWVRDRVTVTTDEGGARFLDGIITDVSAERAAVEGRGLADVYRVTCHRCGAVWPAETVERCPRCESAEVDAISLNATLAELATARQQVEGLLSGVQKHLEALGTNLRTVSGRVAAGPGPDAAGR